MIRATIRFIFPRLPHICYSIAWLILFLQNIALKPFRILSEIKIKSRIKLGIEAGARGWEAIEFNEIERSAQEFLGCEEYVVRHVVDKSKNYVGQVYSFLKHNRPSHYFYDPRTGSQSWWLCLIEALGVSCLLNARGIVPIVYLTDLSVRKWRCQAAIVSATSGIVITFMMPKKIQAIFPHRRLCGPSIMPLSFTTAVQLSLMRNKLENNKAVNDIVRFTGSLYEPRTSFLETLKDLLVVENIHLDIQGRQLGTPRKSDEQYWQNLSSARMVITTAVQAEQSGTDFIWVPHMVYRYLEVMAAGSLLLAPTVPGLIRYFTPYVHYLPFDTVEGAHETIVHYFKYPDEAEAIRLAGHQRVLSLIENHTFWMIVDAFLGSDCLVD